MQIIDMNEKMEAAAGRGKFHLTVIIYHSEYAKRSKVLLNEGLALAQMPTTRDDTKAKYNISWKRCSVEDLPNVWSSEAVIKERPELTLGQRLWLVSKEANKQTVQSIAM